MGLEIPRTAPEEDRLDQLCAVDLVSCFISARFFFSARWRTQVEIKRAAIAPKRAPGKKPASTALLGKEGQLVTVELEEEVESVLREDAETDEDTGVNVAP